METGISALMWVMRLRVMSEVMNFEAMLRS